MQDETTWEYCSSNAELLLKDILDQQLSEQIASKSPVGSLHTHGAGSSHKLIIILKKDYDDDSKDDNEDDCDEAG